MSLGGSGPGTSGGDLTTKKISPITQGSKSPLDPTEKTMLTQAVDIDLRVGEDHVAVFNNMPYMSNGSRDEVKDSLVELGLNLAQLHNEMLQMENV